jgi:hypothetical protein
LLHWFPDRRFQFVGDGNFGTHNMTTYAHRHGRRFTQVSCFYADANLYDLPAARTTRKKGRPRVKGWKLPTSEHVVTHTKRPTLQRRRRCGLGRYNSLQPLGGIPMTTEQVLVIGPEFTAFLRPFERFFDTLKTVCHLRNYTRGLLSDLPSKTAEPLALQAGFPPRNLQQFL